MKLAFPSLLLLRSIHVTAASKANATMLEPLNGTNVAPDITYSRSRLMTPRSSPKAEAGADSIESPQHIIQIVDGDPTGGPVDL